MEAVVQFAALWVTSCGCGGPLLIYDQSAMELTSGVGPWGPASLANKVAVLGFQLVPR
jgi:hypothetical protein